MFIDETGLAKTGDMLKAYVDNKIQNVGEPVEISTALEMNSLLTAENVGKVFLYTGTTDANYTNGDLYVVEQGEITDLTGTTWASKSTYSTSSFIAYSYIEGFYSIGLDTDMTIDGGIVLNGFYKGSGEGYNQSFSNTVGFGNRMYAESPTQWTVTITGGADATDQDLIDWLKANATQIS